MIQFIGCFMLFGVPILTMICYEHFGILGSVAAVVIPLTWIALYSKNDEAKLKNKFEVFRRENKLTFDIIALGYQNGFAIDLSKELFVFLPRHEKFKTISFEDFQSVRHTKERSKNKLIFQVKDIESPLIQIDFPGRDSDIAMARMRAAEIIR
ncbi:MAG: hypothetical protein V3573_13170 [Desulfovibrionaceae bacterium]